MTTGTSQDVVNPATTTSLVANVRDIRRRIRSVRNTQQVTKAMKMVAAAKLRRSQERILAARDLDQATRDKLKEVYGS